MASNNVRISKQGLIRNGGNFMVSCSTCIVLLQFAWKYFLKKLLNDECAQFFSFKGCPFSEKVSLLKATKQEVTKVVSLS